MIVEGLGNPVVDNLSSCEQLSRISLYIRSVQIGTVGASDAGASVRPLVNFRSVLQLSNPLPGILRAVRKEDIRGRNLITAVYVLCARHCGELSHVKFGEDALALVNPIVVFKVARTRSMQLGGGLEEAELCAILVGPGTA